MSGARARRPAVGFIFVTLVLLVLGFGIIIPVLPGLVTEFRGGSVADGSRTYGALVGVFALMQFVASPILGALSDRYGRRRVLLIALAGTAIDYTIMGLAPTLGWLFVARVISGATAGGLATCNAYIADVTPPEKRAQGFGIVGAAFGLGFVIGPAVGGMVGHYGLRLPFFFASACVALNWLYGAFLLPESLPPERRRPFEWKRANPIGSLGTLRRFPGVFDLAGLFFLVQFANVMLQSVWVLYTAYRYGWDTRQVGFSLMLVGIIMAIVQGRLVRPILGRIGDENGLVLGLLLSAATYVGYGSATHGWMIYGFMVLGGLGSISAPAAQSIITRQVTPDQQGAVQGSLAGLISLATIFAPPLSAWSFGACIKPGAPWRLPGISFYEAALLFVVAALLGVLSFRRWRAASARTAPG